MVQFLLHSYFPLTQSSKCFRWDSCVQWFLPLVMCNSFCEYIWSKIVFLVPKIYSMMWHEAPLLSRWLSLVCNLFEFFILLFLPVLLHFLIAPTSFFTNVSQSWFGYVHTFYCIFIDVKVILPSPSPKCIYNIIAFWLKYYCC